MENRDLTPTSGWLLDLALSAAVYLVPLVTAHSMSLIGEYLLRSAAARATISSLWVVSDWITVLAAQLLLLILLRVARRRPLWARMSIALATLIVVTPVLNTMLLWKIPAVFLIERDTVPPSNRLTERCHADGVELLPVPANVFSDASPATVLVVQGADARFAALNVADCSVRRLDIPAGANVMGQNAYAVIWTADRSSTRPREWFVTQSNGRTIRIDGTLVPENTFPQILDDGTAVGWIDASRQLAIYGVDGFQTIPTTGVPSGSLGPLEGASASGPFYVFVMGNEGRWMVVDISGRIVTDLPAPPMLSRFSQHLRPIPGGWIGWDTYVEDRRYVVAWSRGGATTTRELPRGLAFTSIATDDRGAYLAVSATSGLNVGNQQDEVWLLRTSDGQELFRRYAPKYSRSSVLLPGARWFAVSEIRDGRPVVRVYDLPQR